MDWAALLPILGPLAGTLGPFIAVSWLIATGKLIPQSQHEARCADLKDTAAQALAAAALQAETNRDLADSVRTVEELVRALTDAVQRRDAA